MLVPVRWYAGLKAVEQGQSTSFFSSYIALLGRMCHFKEVSDLLETLRQQWYEYQYLNVYRVVVDEVQQLVGHEGLADARGTPKPDPSFPAAVGGFVASWSTGRVRRQNGVQRRYCG